MAIDLKAEAEATLARRRLKYSIRARILFRMMDLIYGRELTLPKIRFLEILARIPYQAWEVRQYWRLGGIFRDGARREHAEEILRWGREAQDNEYWHLLVAHEKMQEDGIKENWLWHRLVPWFGALGWALASRLMALVCIRAAWRLNGEFEDHAEHAYAEYVRDHAELDVQEVGSDLIQDGRGPDGGRYRVWSDVFRRMGLDEREHRNESFRRCCLDRMMVAAPGEGGTGQPEPEPREAQGPGPK